MPRAMVTLSAIVPATNVPPTLLRATAAVARVRALYSLPAVVAA